MFFFLGQSRAIKDVVLQRMPTEVIADRRRMFELFTKIKDQATKERDDYLTELVDLCINLWTKVLFCSMFCTVPSRSLRMFYFFII